MVCRVYFPGQEECESMRPSTTFTTMPAIAVPHKLVDLKHVGSTVAYAGTLAVSDAHDADSSTCQKANHMLV
jgi:hypothetical protein